jgi:hypothetical protein
VVLEGRERCAGSSARQEAQRIAAEDLLTPVRIGHRRLDGGAAALTSP